MPRSPRPTLENLNYFDPATALSAEEHSRLLEAFSDDSDKGIPWEEAREIYKRKIQDPALNHTPKGRRLATEDFLFRDDYNLLGTETATQLIVLDGKYDKMLRGTDVTSAVLIQNLIKVNGKIPVVLSSIRENNGAQD
ncbi:hypothetical protein CMI48_01795 [Candidatus Pacearchaeota archaeon]|nr:hypothetical protein [Candidatus Pacearchaeota archaeon]|tara:strand:- start:706 stop:1119 length:414 start_codon:yes stop_codon:yes gene_type:complete